ncbi:MAG: hypothetical protein R3B72_48110 [Polyangiaceae bacterium]
MEQRRFYAHLLTRRKVGALVVSTLVVASVVGAAVWHNEEGIGDLLQRPESVIWWSFPTWWIVGAVASLVLAPIAAFAILGGKRCPECGGPLENGTTSGDHIVLICTPCGVLWRTGWKVGRASDSIEHHDHHPF